MRIHYHAAFSALIAGFLYMIFKSWGMAIASFVSGVFIDLDHLIDVIREHGWSIKTKGFFQVCHKAQFKRIMLILHGWEWLVLLTPVAWLSDWNPWITGSLIGMTHHMILDAYYNSSNFLSYSLLWRWKKNFEFDLIFPNLLTLKYKYHKHSHDEIRK